MTKETNLSIVLNISNETVIRNKLFDIKRTLKDMSTDFDDIKDLVIPKEKCIVIRQEEVLDTYLETALHIISDISERLDNEHPRQFEDIKDLVEIITIVRSDAYNNINCDYLIHFYDFEENDEDNILHDSVYKHRKRVKKVRDDTVEKLDFILEALSITTTDRFEKVA